MVTNLLIGVFVFLLGLCIGSFLNCVIYRLEEGKSLKGRSFCPRCKHKLSWQDLIPIFSFLMLGGECRYCRKKISIQYPLVELATGILFVLVFLTLGFSWSLGIGIWGLIKLCFLFYVSCSMIIIFVYDLKHYEIPDKVLLPAIGITLAYRLFENFTAFPNYLLGAVIASGLFLTIFLISKGLWMGFGDVKFAALMGFLLGLSNVLAALFFAFFFGAIIGVIQMVLQKKTLKSEIPFGPFLVIGTFIALFWGSQLINWYFNFLLI